MTTMDSLAASLDLAADELAGMKAELAGEEFGFDRAGKGAEELATMVRAAWDRQCELTVRLAGDLAGLAASVRLAAGNYRATDGEAK